MIDWKFEETEAGGRVRIASKDADAIGPRSRSSSDSRSRTIRPATRRRFRPRDVGKTDRAEVSPKSYRTVKLPALVAVPDGVVTLTFPVVAPDGTMAVI